jgi:transcriptional regulator with GAF, ATPase, and Fis domain
VNISARESQSPTHSLADEVCSRSTDRWGRDQATVIVGRHPSMSCALEQAARFASSDSPVLITGETGTGKELFARAIYLLSARSKGPFISVNCAQYQEGQLMASELFGHKRGSFTGASSDHRGIFEAADDGVVFLDEIGELSLAAQAMMLRLLSGGEIVPVGESRARQVNVRVVVATNRDLKQMVSSGRFRADLYYRLRYLQLRVPPVRDRGDDWEILVAHHLERLGRPSHQHKRFSPAALAVLGRHPWPGNVREILGVVDTAFHLSDGATIEPGDFLQAMEEVTRIDQISSVPWSTAGVAILSRLLKGEGSFWTLVHQPYLDRDLNRSEVRDIVAQGLAQTGGSYKRLLAAFGGGPDEYLRFMDFLRHHRLKPAEPRPAP